MRSGKGQAASPHEFQQIAKLRNPSIHVAFIPASKIQEEKAPLEGFWKDTIAVPFTHKVHSVEPKGQNNLVIAETSDSLNKTEVHIRKPSETDSDGELEEEMEELCENDHDTTTLDPVDCLHIREDLQIGDWVLVEYMQNTFPGEISGFADDKPQVRAKIMHKSRSYWKWPTGKPLCIFGSP